MSRLATAAGMGALALGWLATPATSHAAELCVIELIGYYHYYWYPPAGSCALAAYDIAVDHCGNVWDNDWVATSTAYGGKWVSGPQTFEFTCEEGQVAWFSW